MYYKEDIINGVLCFKTTPNGEWREFSKENLTKRIKELEEKINNVNR
jgi:hypothetical protein